MLTWQTAIILQIIVSTGMTLFTRHITRVSPRHFYSVGLFSYIGVAIMGAVYALAFLGGNIQLPPASAWLFIAIESIGIPAAWLIQYKLIARIGAANAMVASTINTVCASIGGVLFLQDQLTGLFIIGASLIVTASYLVLRIRADTERSTKLPILAGAGLIASGALLFAIGMTSEKVVIDMIGVWDYALFGWSGQAVGAVTLLAMFGRKELSHISPQIVKHGLLLGLITSVAGGLYIYAVSLGPLSHTVIATSGKLVLTSIVAAIIFHERNSLPTRVIATTLAILGIWMVIA